MCIAQSCLHLCCSQTPEDMFSGVKAHIITDCRDMTQKAESIVKPNYYSNKISLVLSWKVIVFGVLRAYVHQSCQNHISVCIGLI